MTNFKGFDKKIKIKPRDQLLKHIKQEDLSEDFDIDFDTKEKPEEPKQSKGETKDEKPAEAKEAAVGSDKTE